MKPAFSSARQIASSPSLQFQLGMFSRWAWEEAQRAGREGVLREGVREGVRGGVERRGEGAAFLWDV